MDNQRLLVWAAFGMLAFMTYQAWLQDYAPASAPVEPAAVSEERPPAQPPADDALPGLPSADPSDASTPALPPETAVGFESPNADVLATAGEVIRVSTDVFEIEINTAGGKLQRAVLKNYPVAKDQPDTLVELLSTEELRFASIQSGLIADTGDGELTSMHC